MRAVRYEHPVDRDAATRRYLELRPVARARLTASVPEDLRREFESLTAHQLRALLLLPDAGLPMHELAAALGVMGATVSVLADRLVAQDLATRVPDPQDRRVVRLAPSESGRALAARAVTQQCRSAAEIFDRLSDAQVIAFLDVLETLAAEGPRTGTALVASTQGVLAAHGTRQARSPGSRGAQSVRAEAR
ncbi:MAG: MarR family winged helix-turn-helix transcriptional regulator [Acidimicrobiales bacterium]